MPFNKNGNDIASRLDLEFLVTRFYDQVRKDAEIGHFFNNTIDDWPVHISKLVDFWETNLFFVQKYKGNPIRTHCQLDRQMSHSITNYHFGIWLRHWLQVINDHFEGPNAEKAKQRARNISIRMFMSIFENRNPTSKG